MTAPSVVPYFQDAELRNGLPDSASLTRRLVRWQRWARERMTGQTPCWARAARTFRSIHAVAVHAYRFYVPAPPSPNRTLRVWWTEVVNASTGLISLKSQRTGTVQRLNPAAIDYKTRTATATIEGPDVVDVYVEQLTGGTTPYYPTSISAWWEPAAAGAYPGITFDTSWTALLQGALAEGSPDSMYVLRWLALKSNQLMNDRQRCVFSTRTNMGTKASIRVAPFIPSIKIWVYAKSASATTFTMTFYDVGNISPIGSASISIPGDNTWAWRSTTFNTGFTAERILYQSAANGAASVGTVAIEEDQPTATSLALPASQAVPAAFVNIDDLSIRGRTPIYADLRGASRARGRAALIENMIWLWASKVRTIWMENPIAPPLNYAGGTPLGNSDPPSYQTQELVRFRATPDGWTKQLRVAGSSAIGFDGVAPYADAGGQGIATGEYAPENGGAGGLKTLATRIPTKEWPNEWYVEEAPAVDSGAAFVFRALLMNPPAAGQPIKAYSNGLVVEELPYGTTTTAWP